MICCAAVRSRIRSAAEVLGAFSAFEKYPWARQFTSKEVLGCWWHHPLQYNSQLLGFGLPIQRSSGVTDCAGFGLKTK